jgi:hypothetical protein
MLGWRDICRSTDERTTISTVIPRGAVGNKVPLILAESDGFLPGLAACLSSFVQDFASRQKIGSTTMNFFILMQLPVCAPRSFMDICSWDDISVEDWLVPRLLELFYTAADLRPFARDLGDDGLPFCWDPERRFLLRAELDAAFFHIYGVSQDDTGYILDTFPIVRHKDEERYGEYRTKRLILEIYDAMQKAIDTGGQYRTILYPPPGHGPRHPGRPGGTA